MQTSFHKLPAQIRRNLANLVGISDSEFPIEHLLNPSPTDDETESDPDAALILGIGKLLVKYFNRSRLALKREKETDISEIQSILNRHVSDLRNFRMKDTGCIQGVKGFEVIADMHENKSVRIQIPDTYVYSEDCVHFLSHNSKTARMSNKHLLSEMYKIVTRKDSSCSYVLKMTNTSSNMKNTVFKKDSQNSLLFAVKNNLDKKIPFVLQEFVSEEGYNQLRLHYLEGNIKLYKIEVGQIHEMVVPYVYKKWLDENQSSIQALNFKTLMNVYKYLLKICDFYMKIGEEVKDSSEEGHLILDYFTEKHKIYAKNYKILKRNKNAVTENCVHEYKPDKELYYYNKIISDLRTYILKHYHEKYAMAEFSADFMQKGSKIILIDVLVIKLRSNNRVLKTRSHDIRIPNHIQMPKLAIKGCHGDYCCILNPLTNLNIDKKTEIKYPVLTEILNFHNMLKNDPLLPYIRDNNIQYKVQKKIISDDNSDTKSLKSLLKEIPPQILRKFDIVIPNRSKLRSRFHSEMMYWELELVNVCYLCYKIYKSKEVSADVFDCEVSSLNKSNTFSRFYNRASTSSKISNKDFRVQIVHGINRRRIHNSSEYHQSKNAQQNSFSTSEVKNIRKVSAPPKEIDIRRKATDHISSCCQLLDNLVRRQSKK